MDITPAQTTSVGAINDGVCPGSRYDDACLAEIEAWGKDKVMESRPAGRSGAGIWGTGYSKSGPSKVARRDTMVRTEARLDSMVELPRSSLLASLVLLVSFGLAGCERWPGVRGGGVRAGVEWIGELPYGTLGRHRMSGLGYRNGR